jgi:Domain of unknown function (DUF5615)
LKLLLDDMYAGAHEQALRAVDVDAAAVIALGLAGSSDREALAAAVAQGRTMLTENVADFTRISAEHLTAGQHHPGVLIARSPRFLRRPAVIRSLVNAILGVAHPELTNPRDLSASAREGLRPDTGWQARTRSAPGTVAPGALDPDGLPL